MRKMTPIERDTLIKEVEFARARGKPTTPAPVDLECIVDQIDHQDYISSHIEHKAY